MPDVHDLALALRNLEIDYKQSLVVVFAEDTFLPSPENILWIERCLTSVESRPTFVYNVRGLPVAVSDMQGLLAAMKARLFEASSKFLTAHQELRKELVNSYKEINTVPEREHEE